MSYLMLLVLLLVVIALQTSPTTEVSTLALVMLPTARRLKHVQVIPSIVMEHHTVVRATKAVLLLLEAVKLSVVVLPTSLEIAIS